MRTPTRGSARSPGGGRRRMATPPTTAGRTGGTSTVGRAITSEAARNEERPAVCNQNDVPNHAGDGTIPGQSVSERGRQKAHRPRPKGREGDSHGSTPEKHRRGGPAPDGGSRNVGLPQGGSRP